MKDKRQILLLTFLSVLFVSCGKQEGATEYGGHEGHEGYEGYEDHPTWTDSNPEAFWDKQADGDTTINF